MLDSRIEATYAKRSRGQLKSKLYDSYIRAFRWATDRISDSGVVAFVSNGGWLDANTADGIRLSLAEEYSHIYVYNLRGNSRVRGRAASAEGGNVFNVRVGIAIFIGIKLPHHSGKCVIEYSEIEPNLTRQQKLSKLSDLQLTSIPWRSIVPNTEGDWAKQRDTSFSAWPALGKTRGSSSPSIFRQHSLGLFTSRDAWSYNFSRNELLRNVRRLVSNYQVARDFFNRFTHDAGENRSESLVNKFLLTEKDLADASFVKWSAGLKKRLARDEQIRVNQADARVCAYRPFNLQVGYFGEKLCERRGSLEMMFPTAKHQNHGIAIIAPRDGTDFTVLMTNAMPDLSFFTYAVQFFPRYTYERVTHKHQLRFDEEQDTSGYRRIDNISDELLKVYRDAVGEKVTKNDIFNYVYGILHDPTYRERYAADLQKMLPRIPLPDTVDRFAAVADIGRQLAELHLNYEQARGYELDVQLKSGIDPDDRETWRVSKIKWRSKADHSALTYNGKVSITGIPDEAHEYMLGSRSALEWIIDRYQVKTDKSSGIVNDPNDWCDERDDPTYIVNLIKKITTVSVETMKLVAELRRT